MDNDAVEENSKKQSKNYYPTTGNCKKIHCKRLSSFLFKIIFVLIYALSEADILENWKILRII